MSFWTKPIEAAVIAVNAPTTTTTVIVVSDNANRAEFLATKNMPAVTIVAACINAETEVGPAIASGSQTASGNCADFPVHPRNIINVIAVIIPAFIYSI